MIVPSPFPGEYVSGLLGRCRIINGLPNTTHLLESIKSVPSVNASKNPTVVEKVAHIFSLDTKEFVQQHTLIPITRAFVEDKYDLLHGDISLPNVLTRSWVTRIPQARICLSCIAEDNDFWGISYWRRAHQIAGVHWCSKHHSPLHSIQHPNPFDYLPEYLVKYASLLADAETMMKSDVLMRFSEIMFDLLDRKAPLPVRNVASLIKNRASSLNLRISSKGKRKVISDLALEQVPAEWLQINFPSVIGKASCSFISKLDGIATSAVPFATQAYALAASLLWESSDDAMTAIVNSTNNAVQKVREKRYYAADYWSSEEIFNIYVDSRGINKTIANKLKGDANYIADQLAKNGLPCLGNLSINRAIAALLEFRNGSSIPEACNKYDVSIKTIENLLRIGNAKFFKALDMISESQVLN